MSLKVLQRRILQEISKPTSRGGQVKVGPSEIGDCPYCLGQKLALRVPDVYPNLTHEEDFGLGAWVGTGVHLNIEQTFDLPGAVHETKLDLFELPGYGMIRGSCDMFWENQVWDWKVLGKYTFDTMSLAYRKDSTRIPKTVYRVQQHLYGYGWKLLGREVETVNIVAIPKLSNRLEDIKFFSETYNQQVVDSAIERLVRLWEYVQDGRLEELPSDKECYTCTRVTYRFQDQEAA